MKPGVASAAVRAAWEAAYDDEPFVHLLPAGQWPRTADVLGSNNVHLQVALDERTGAVRWRTTTPEKIGQMSPVISGSLLFTVNEQGAGFIHAFDASTGRLLWTGKSPGAQWVFPANGKLCVIEEGFVREYAPR